MTAYKTIPPCTCDSEFHENDCVEGAIAYLKSRGFTARQVVQALAAQPSTSSSVGPTVDERGVAFDRGISDAAWDALKCVPMRNKVSIADFRDFVSILQHNAHKHAHLFFSIHPPTR